jgi:hypothetical protein
MFTLCCWSLCVGSLLFSSNSEEEKLRLEQEQQAAKQQNEVQIEGIKVGPSFEYNMDIENAESNKDNFLNHKDYEGVIQVQESIETYEESSESQESLDKRALDEGNMLQIKQIHNESNSSEINTDAQMTLEKEASLQAKIDAMNQRRYEYSEK